MLADMITNILLPALCLLAIYLSLHLLHARRGGRNDASRHHPTRLLLVTLLLLMALGITALVLQQHTVEPDRQILLFIGTHRVAWLTTLFSIITLTGSAIVLTPLSIGLTAALLLARRWRLAALLSGSMLGSVLLIDLSKRAIARARPALWETQWYAGYSFPSGHALGAAACATALALCASRLWPSLRRPALGAAGIWILLVALSRLVLGVHWPTDVLAAACAGIALPILLDLLLHPHTR